MSNNENVSLYLQLVNDTLDVITNDNTTYIEENIPVWIIENNHNISLSVDNYIIEGSDGQHSQDFYLVINNSKEEPIEMIGLTHQGNGKYLGKASITKFLKDNSVIFIGVYYFDTKTGTTILSNSIPIALNNGVNVGLEVKDVVDKAPFLGELLEKLTKGKTLQDIEVIRINQDGDINKPKGFYLRVTYYGVKDPIDYGPIAPTAITLDLVTARSEDDQKGGGGSVGVLAHLNGTKTGFSGGYKAQASKGAAAGEDARAGQGVALGRNADSMPSLDGIAIGVNSTITGFTGSGDKTSGSIAIGSNTTITNTSDSNTGNLAIGRYTKIYKSRNAIAIGSSNSETVKDSNNQPTKYEDMGSYNCSAVTRVNSSEDGVAIGSRTFITRTKYCIAIGTKAVVSGIGKTETRNAHTVKYAMAIGKDAVVRSTAALAIGNGAKAGASQEGALLAGNQSDEQSRYGSAIAIGDRSWARRSSSVALGKLAVALQYGCIAVGEQAEAGTRTNIKGTDTITLEKDKTKNFAPMAVAIGVKAKATAREAVQIGNGENNEAYTLKFRKTTIVKNNVVQFNLQKGQSGTLPIKNGGTGATTASAARQSLGVFAGEHSFTVDTKTKPTKGVTGTVKFSKKMSSVPKVVATLEMTDSDENINPVYHHLIITGVTTSGFTYKYNYNGSLKKKLSLSINYVCIV